MLTSLPLIAIAGSVSAQLLTRVSSKRLTSYSDAADTVEQTIRSIRTVSSNYISYWKLYHLSQLIQIQEPDLLNSDLWPLPSPH